MSTGTVEKTLSYPLKNLPESDDWTSEQERTIAPVEASTRKHIKKTFDVTNPHEGMSIPEQIQKLDDIHRLLTDALQKEEDKTTTVFNILKTMIDITMIWKADLNKKVSEQLASENKSLTEDSMDEEGDQDEEGGRVNSKGINELAEVAKEHVDLRPILDTLNDKERGVLVAILKHFNVRITTLTTMLNGFLQISMNNSRNLDEVVQALRAEFEDKVELA